jgi:acetyltransferase-like isoleucine patch superfamily enzyme
MKSLYELKNSILTHHYCRKYHIKKTKGLIIEKGFKVYNKTKVELGEFCHICKNVVLAGGGTINIGNHSTIFRDSEIHSYINSSIRIGNDCLVAKDAYIINSNHSFKLNELIRRQTPTAKDIIIGNDVWLGGRVTVLMGVSIGDGSVIGAGSIVNKSIQKNSIAVGVPCKSIKKRN